MDGKDVGVLSIVLVIALVLGTTCNVISTAYRVKQTFGGSKKKVKSRRKERK